MSNDIPRRNRFDLMTPEEKSIYEMVGEVEKLGAHPLLTDCVVLLDEARAKLADWVDEQAAQQGRAVDCPDCGGELYVLVRCVKCQHMQAVSR